MTVPHLLNSRRFWILTCITALGAALRLGLALSNGSLWFDEAFSAHFALMPLAKSLPLLRAETNPPLHIIFLHYWIALVGNSDLALRTLSVIFGTLTIPMTTLVGRRMIGNTSSMWGALIMALTPLAIIHSAEARGYPLVILTTLTTIYAYMRVLDAPAHRWWNSALATSACVLVATHLEGWFILAVLAIWSIYLYYKHMIAKVTMRNLGIGMSILMLLALGWTVSGWDVRTNSIFDGWYFAFAPSAHFALDRMADFIAYDLQWPALMGLLGWLGLVALLHALLTIEHAAHSLRIALRHDMAREFLALWLMLPLLAGAFIGVHVAKYYIVALPALCLLVGALITRARTFVTPLVLSFVVIALMLPGLVTLNTHAHTGYWDTLARTIEKSERASDGLWVQSFVQVLPLSRYYHGILTPQPLYPHQDNLTLDERIIQKNWVLLVADHTYGKILERLSAGKTRIWLVTAAANDPPLHNPTFMWLIQHHWSIVETQRFNGYLQPITLTLWERY